MNSLPPQARVSDVPTFLDRDEAESLTEALLSLVEEDPTLADEGDSVSVMPGPSETAEKHDGRADMLAEEQDNVLDEAEDNQSVETGGGAVKNLFGDSDQPVDLLDDLFDGPEDNTEALDDEDSWPTIQESTVCADADADPDTMDDVQKALQEALASKDSDIPKTGEALADETAGRTARSPGVEDLDQAPREEASAEFGRPVSDPGLVFFSRPTPPGADAPTPDDVFLFESGESLSVSTPDTDVKGQEDIQVDDKIDVRDGDDAGTCASSETVAGSGPSEDTSSETIAESGNRSLFDELDDRSTIERKVRGVRVLAGMPRQQVESRSCQATAGSTSEPEQRKSFSWFCSERSMSNSREGFDKEERDSTPSTGSKRVQSESQRKDNDVPQLRTDPLDLLEDDATSAPGSRWSAPFLASSDIAGIQTFRTRGARIKHLRLLASRGQEEPPRSATENDSVNGTASLLFNRSISGLREEKSSVILAGMMAIGFVIFTWLLYLYLVKDPGLSSSKVVGADSALLLGPTAFRLRHRFGLRNRLKLATLAADTASIFGATGGTKIDLEDRGLSGSVESRQEERFVVHSIGTRDFAPTETSVAVFVVDLPRLRCRERIDHAASIKLSNATRCRGHRNGVPLRVQRQSVVNRRIGVRY